MYFFQATTPPTPPNPQNIIFDQTAITEELKKIMQTNTLPGEMAKTVAEVDTLATKVLHTFGQGREMIMGLKLSMTNAYEKVALLGGSMADVNAQQINVSEALNRNFAIASSSIEDFYAITKVTGVDSKTMVSNFKDAGISAYQASGEMQKIVDTTRAIGVNVRDVSATVVTNLDKLNKYNFEGGVQGLAKMAAQSALLKVDMNNIFTVVDKAFNPESAIELAASLQRLGVAQSDLLDPLRLMDLSQNDPAELQNQISKMSQQFVQLNKDGKFEIMPGAKRQLIEIELALGMSSGTLAKMALNSADLGSKLQQIKFPEFLSEEQRTFFANLAEKDVDGIYKITIDDKKVGLSEALAKYGTSPEKMKELQEATKPKQIIDIAKEQLNFTEKIWGLLNTTRGVTGRVLASQKTGEGTLNFLKDFAEDLVGKVKQPGGGLNQDDIRKGIKGMEDSIIKMVNEDKKAGKSNKDINEHVQKFVTQELGKVARAAGKTMANIPQMIKEVFAGKNLLNYIGKAQDFILTPNGVLETHKEDTIIGMTKGGEFMNSLKTDDKKNTTNIIETSKPKVSTDNSKIMNLNKEMSTFKNTITTTQSQNTTSTIDVNLNHTVTINAPSGVDTQQLILALKNEEIKQSIIHSILKGITNDGRTASNSNPQRLMNSYQKTY
jgi:hypothetical protein